MKEADKSGSGSENDDDSNDDEDDDSDNWSSRKICKIDLVYQN